MLERVSPGLYEAGKAGSEKACSDLLDPFTSKLRQFKRDKPQIRFEIDPQASSFLTYLSLGIFAEEVSKDADDSALCRAAQKFTELAATQASGVVPTPGERIPISIPSKFTGKDGSVDVRPWMKQLLRYLKLKSAKPSDYGNLAGSFLEGIALQIWEVELNDLELQSRSVTWETFQEVLVTFSLVHRHLLGICASSIISVLKFPLLRTMSKVWSQLSNFSWIRLCNPLMKISSTISWMDLSLSLRRKHG